MTRAMSCAGPIIRTFAPRLRSASVSSAAVLPAIARSIPNGEAIAMSRLAIGFRHSTCVARPAGAMSRFVLLQTPPSTYSRPPICTGAKIHGTEQDACTASATRRVGRAGRAEDDAPAVARGRRRRRAGARRSARRPRSTRVADRRQRRVAARRAAEQRGAQRGAAVRAGGERHRRQRRRGGARQPHGLARDALQDAARQRQPLRARGATRSRRRRRRSSSPGGQREPVRCRPRPARALPGDERRRDERARRRPDERLGRRGSRGRWRPRCRRARRSSRPRRACRRWRARARRGAGRARSRAAGWRVARRGRARPQPAGASAMRTSAVGQPTTSTASYCDNIRPSMPARMTLT